MILRFTLLLALIALVGCDTAPQSGFSITEAQVRGLIPGSDKTVGYVRISNASDRVRALVGAEAAGVGAIEIHTTQEVDGLMRMRRLERIEIPAGGEIVLETGGHHLMLFRVDALLDPLPVTLVFEDGQRLTHPFAVAPIL